ncbi:MAG: response regulator, partial [Desulfovibrionaceae bacterium]
MKNLTPRTGKELREMARNMAAGSKPDVSSFSGEEIERLLVELGVYQTELQAQNEELKDARTEQRRMAENYRSLFETAPVSYLVLDERANILQANRQARELLADWRADPCGLPLSSCLDQEWTLDFHANVQAVVRGAPARTFETRLANGTHLYAECSREPGPERNLRLVLMDITDRGRMEEELKEAKQAAEDASRMKSDFLAVMSHEIRTPLNGVLGMLQLLERSELDDKQRTLLQTAKDSGRTLLEIINDILEFSRIEAGKAGLREETFNIRRLLTGLAELFEPQAREKGISLELDVEDDLPRLVRGDPYRLRQILFNLVGNAVKFTSSGKVVLEARAVSGQETVLLECSVRDTGPGLSQNKLQAVFEPFTQFDGPFRRRHQGTGLGLAIVQRLASLMDGEALVDSTPGVGSVFTVRVRMKPAGEEQAGPEAHRIEPVEFKVGRDIRVLVAEDNRVNALYAQETLNSMGVRTRVVENGAHALRALEEEPYDLVLMDVEMPVMDGVSATRALRTSNLPWGNSRIPVVALTAHAMEGDRDKMMEYSMDDYLAKPFQMQELQELLQRLLGG